MRKKVGKTKSQNKKSKSSKNLRLPSEKGYSYKVYDAMTTNPVIISESSSIQQAAQKMATNHVSSLLIKKSEKLIGILTERDITRKVAAKNISAKNTKVKDVMSTQLCTIGPLADIHEAMRMMGNVNKRQIPVVDNGKLVGLLTLKDILKIQPQLIGLIYEKLNIREADRKPVYHPDNEGICQLCGNYSFSLSDEDGLFVCIDCKETHE